MLDMEKHAKIEKKIEAKLEIIENFLNQGVSISKVYDEFICKELNWTINKKYFFRVLKKLRDNPKKTEKKQEKPIIFSQASNKNKVETSNNNKADDNMFLSNKSIKYEEEYAVIYGKYWWFNKFLDVSEIRKVRDELVNELSSDIQIERYKQALNAKSYDDKYKEFTLAQTYADLFFSKLVIKELGEKEFNDIKMQARANKFLVNAEKLLS